MLPTKFRFIWQSGFRGEDFFKLVNQKQEYGRQGMAKAHFAFGKVS
jgi:hypothetical protein